MLTQCTPNAHPVHTWCSPSAHLMLTQCTPNAHPVHTWRFIRKAHVCELLCLLTYFKIVGHEYQKHQLFHIKKISQTTWVHFLLQYSTYFQLLFIQCNHFLNILSLSSWVLLKACCLMGTKPLPGQIHTTCNKWFAISKLTHCGLVTPYGARDLGKHWLM